MFEIYAYGNVDTLTGVFNAIAAIMGGDDYFGLIKTVAVTGVLVAAFAGLFTPGRFHGWSWLMGFMLSTTLSSSPRAMSSSSTSSEAKPPWWSAMCRSASRSSAITRARWVT
jgi:hypothetical protein